MKTFAVIEKERDCLVAMAAARKKRELSEDYPASGFDLVDMTGKGSPPAAPGLMASDVTVDRSTKEWKIKGKTTEERTAAAGIGKIVALRHRLVDLEIRKDKATALGDGYAEVLSEIQAGINATKAEITELEG